MDRRTKQKELQSFEEFVKALREEIEVSSQYDLPLTVLACRIEGGWSEESIKHALDTLRSADLIALPEHGNLFIALPNTSAEAALAVKKRLARTVPRIRTGVAGYRSSEKVEDLLSRGREAVRAEAGLE